MPGLTTGGPGGLEAGVAAALHTPRWSRDNTEAERILLRYRHADFVPAEAAGGAVAPNPSFLAALRHYARVLYGTAGTVHARRVGVAVIDVPYGAVHRHLAIAKELPFTVDKLVSEAAATLLSQKGHR